MSIQLIYIFIYLKLQCQIHSASFLVLHLKKCNYINGEFFEYIKIKIVKTKSVNMILNQLVYVYLSLFCTIGKKKN